MGQEIPIILVVYNRVDRVFGSPTSRYSTLYHLMPVMVNNKWVIDQRKKACHMKRERWVLNYILGAYNAVYN